MPSKPASLLEESPQRSAVLDHVVLLVDNDGKARRKLHDIVLRLIGPMGKFKILEVSTFASAITAVAECKAGLDLIIIEPYLPDAKDTAVFECIENAWKGLPIVVVSAMEDTRWPLLFLKAGILGFIQKNSNTEEMVKALRLIFSGTRYFPDQALLALAEENSSGFRDAAIPNLGMAAKSLGLHRIELSPRQTEVLHLILKGYANKEISWELGISVGTAKNHVAAVLHALRVDTRAKAALVAVRRGFRK